MRCAVGNACVTMVLQHTQPRDLHDFLSLCKQMQEFEIALSPLHIRYIVYACVCTCLCVRDCV